MSNVDVTDLMDTGIKAAGKKTKASFTWRGKVYLIRLTNFRWLVDTQDGKPVACRYH
jgi:hypothetical protein